MSDAAAGELGGWKVAPTKATVLQLYLLRGDPFCVRIHLVTFPFILCSLKNVYLLEKCQQLFSIEQVFTKIII